MELQNLYTEEGGTVSFGCFNLKIQVSTSKQCNLSDESVRSAAYEAARLIKSAVMANVAANDQAAQARRVAQREQLIGLFWLPIHVDEIPNGYCSDWCCKHLPWFIVTTRIGRITIGWRKRVINIDWSDTLGTRTAKELFPEENVTKGDRYIHARSIEDAKRYLGVIISSANQIQ